MEKIMADTYGVFTFTKSDDSIVDESALARALNQFQWDTSCGQWIYDAAAGGLYHSEYAAQYPTVYPQKITTVDCYCDETDTTYTKTAEEMTEQDWENMEGCEYEDCELSELKELLISHIKEGWFEIGYSSNQKQRYVAFGTIRIAADGVATRRYAVSGITSGCGFEEETA
jgi:hypothetical protein